MMDKELIVIIILILIIFIYIGLVVNKLEKQVNNKIKELNFSNLTIIKDIENKINNTNELLADEKKRLQEGYYKEGKELFNKSKI